MPIVNELTHHAFTLTYIALGTAFSLLVVLAGMILALRWGFERCMKFANGKSIEQYGDSRDKALAAAVAVTTLIEHQKFCKDVMQD